MRKLGFAHQHWTVHLIKNLTHNLKLKITEELDKYKLELRKTNQNSPKAKSKKCEKQKRRTIRWNKTLREIILWIISSTIIWQNNKLHKPIKQDLTNFPKRIQD